MRIIYSFNKTDYEGKCWAQEIQAASNDKFTFVPFNHGIYLNPVLYSNAHRLDQLYQSRNPNLLQMYSVLQNLIQKEHIDAIIVTNAPPYHPDFLYHLHIYKALFSADDPGSTYLINIPYLHAYDHVFFVDPVYSQDFNMTEKMHYCGKTNANWLPISVFNFEYDSNKSEKDLIAQKRDIDIIYVGSFWKQKINTLLKVKKAFSSRFKIYGYFRLKHNLYLNVRFGFGDWVRPITPQERVALYQRSKIGINIHWNEYGLGNQRLYHLPANGVMQISDCAEHLHRIFEPGQEIVGYCGNDDLIKNIRFYLNNESARIKIAENGYRRVMSQYRFTDVTRRAGEMIKEGMKRFSR